MKFDMSRAWNDASAMLAGNIGMVGIIAGVFFFLPYLAMFLFVPEMTQAGASATQPQNPEAAVAAATALYAENWWIFLGLAILQGIGMISLLTLLTDKARPTVQEALSFGIKALLPYLGAGLLQSVIAAILLGLPLGLGMASGSGLVIGLVSILAMVGGIYLFTKFSLMSPVIAIERVLNPIQVLRRSWALTKGNSLRLFLFYFLLMLVLVVLSLVVTMVFGLIFALAGSSIALIGNGLISALFNAVFVCIFLAVLAAAHSQLSGGTPETIGETFD